MSNVAFLRRYALWPTMLCLLLCIAAWIWLALPESVQTRRASGSGKIVRSQFEPTLPEQVDALIVAPSTIADVTATQAKIINSGVPFSAAPNPAPTPYHFTGPALDRERAATCLAAAQIYEAGDDDEGQRAVAQVILNRLRHPVYPKTVCGVVFQGQERQTGCQFTFTCDGAMAHRPSAVRWGKARAIALQMLDGMTYKPIGYATHYHTDWVVPYWSSSLDKVAAVRTHLFFRWKGGWGRPSAFLWHGVQAEPAIAKLAALSPLHASETPVGFETGDQASAPGGLAGPLEIKPSLTRADSLAGSVKVIAHLPQSNAFIVQFADGVRQESYSRLAQQLCSELVRCNLMAWSAAQRAPAGFPLASGALSTMLFNYVQENRLDGGGSFWNCRLTTPVQGSQCLGDSKPHLTAGPGGVSVPAASAGS